LSLVAALGEIGGEAPAARRLRLFTVFHGNLDFSALPDRDLPLVIERCYWPLLAIAAEARIPLGIEMPARTLERVTAEDPEWTKTFRELSERGLVEPVGSGDVQLIGPLVPADVNRANLAFGRERYAALLGAAPTTWFVNEQTFARGLAPLYRAAGAERLVMEWNNPASQHPALRPLRYRPASVAAGDEPLPLLWNDSVVFQKLQRAVHGATPVREYLEAVLSAASNGELIHGLCAYGGDLEIFDYRPGHPVPQGAERGEEMARLDATLRALAAQPEVEFRLPRDVWRDVAPGPVVDLTGASEPIPCKKQPRYNPTRWAVSGRDGSGQNTRCFMLSRWIAAERGLGGPPAGVGDPRRDLVRLWGSDYRTRATEERLTAFHARMGIALAGVHTRVAGRLPAPVEGEDVLLVNASEEAWSGYPVEVALHLPPGRWHDAVPIATPEETLPPGRYQLEVHGRYRDGSVRRAVLVLEPELPPGGELRLRLEPAPRVRRPDQTRGAGDPLPETLATEPVAARFCHHRGGALGALSFPALGGAALLGTVAHGSYDEIAYTPDFYSGHVVAVTEDGKKLTDLRPPDAFAVHHGALRSTIGLRVKTPIGEWTKLYRLYRRHPRLDLVHGLAFHEARLASLRLGTFTALPGGLARKGLGYATVNGGEAVESFPLAPGERVEQHAPIPGATTARSCLGATEGFVTLADGTRAVTILGDRSQSAVVPMLEFADVGEGGFLRLHHTLAETDETRARFFRGFRRVAFAVLGHSAGDEAGRRLSGAVQRGLVYRTERGVGIARGV